MELLKLFTRNFHFYLQANLIYDDLQNIKKTKHRSPMFRYYEIGLSRPKERKVVSGTACRTASRLSGRLTSIKSALNVPCHTFRTLTAITVTNPRIACALLVKTFYFRESCTKGQGLREYVLDRSSSIGLLPRSD